MSGKLEITNVGSSCFVNSALQLLTRIEFGYREIPLNPVCKLVNNLTHRKWQEQSDKIIDGNDIIQILNKHLPIQYNRTQEDAYEYLQALIEGLDQPELVKDLITGTWEYTTECDTCKTVSKRQENFDQLHIALANQNDTFMSSKNISMVDYLGKFFTPEILQGDNAYACDCCQRKTKAIRKTYVHKFPKYWIMHVLRFQIKDGMDIKLMNNFEFTLKLKDGTSKVDYDLVGAIMHHGQHRLSGHYVAYNRDLKQKDVWYRYNDASFSQVKEETLFNDGNKKNVYVLLYMKNESKID